MYNTETQRVIKNRILQNIKSDLAKNEGSTLSNISAGISIDLAEIYAALSRTEQLVFIKNTFDEFLDERIGEFGIYRKQGEHSKGVVYVEGNTGAHIINGDRIESGGLLYVVIQDLTLQDDNELNFTQVEAVDTGVKYNLLPDTEFNLVEANSNIKRIYNRVMFQGGTEPETDEELRTRFELFQRNKATSGNVADYIQWAMSVDGVKDVRVYPLWAGNGTVKLLIFGDGDGLVDDEVLNSCTEYINMKKPIGADVTVIRPELVTVNIVAQIKTKENSNLEEIKNEFSVLVNEYFKDAGKNIAYLKVVGILASLDSVVDITSLTLNGSTENIVITDEQIAHVSTSNITEVV